MGAPMVKGAPKASDRKADAFESLAECLYRTMERLDPMGMPIWQEAATKEQEFCRHCVKALLSRRSLLFRALDLPDHDLKDGRAKFGK